MNKYTAFFNARNYKGVICDLSGEAESDNLEEAKTLIRAKAERKCLPCDNIHAFIFDWQEKKSVCYSDRIVTEEKIYWTDWRML